MTATPADSTKSRGEWAESLACRFLRGKGLKELHRNYRCRRGEIDIVMGDGDTIVFVEVRYRKRSSLVGGAESVDASKQRRLAVTAEHYLQRHHRSRERPCRFDVVAVTAQGSADDIQWIPNAFET